MESVVRLQERGTSDGPLCLDSGPVPERVEGDSAVTLLKQAVQCIGIGDVGSITSDPGFDEYELTVAGEWTAQAVPGRADRSIEVQNGEVWKS